MFAFISDVHGNYPALKAVIKEITALGCKKIFSLGDVAGYYCMINECVDLLKEHNVVNIMGNHDHYLTSKNGCPRSNSANVCLDYQRKVVTPENLKWLAASLPRLKFQNIYMVHGGWQDLLDEYMFDVKEEYFSNLTGRFFLSGHSHVQMLKIFKEKTYCNPGSVGQPRDGNPKAAFAILNKDQIILKRITYNIDEIATAMQLAGFTNYFSENLYHGTAIGGKIFTDKGSNAQ